MRVVALDLETTGLSSQYDQILQIGVAVMERGEVIGEPFYTRVQGSVKLKISLEALDAQIGVLSAPDGPDRLAEWYRLVMDAPSSRDVAVAFRAWAEAMECARYPVVAHNASFDYAFCANWWGFQQRVLFGYRSPLSPMWICTKELAQQDERFTGMKSFGLDQVAKVLDLPPRPAEHDALQDAILAGKVFHALQSAPTTALPLTP